MNFTPLIGLAIGAIAGGVIAPIIDAATLAYDDEHAPTPSVSARFSASKDGGMLAVAARF